MREKTSLGVIVPCYNEENNVSYFENELVQFYDTIGRQNPHLDVHFYVVDNNSTDGTPEKLQSVAQRHSKVKIVRCSKQGYGAALKYGFEAAKEHSFLGFLDFDNTYPMLSFVELLENLKSKDLDIVFGARLHAQSDIGFVRRIGNEFYVVLLKVMLRSPLTDVCSGMRVFKTDRLASVLSLESDDLAFSIHFTGHAVRNKWKLGEVPINYRNRVGDSKLSVVMDGTKFLKTLLMVALKRNS